MVTLSRFKVTPAKVPGVFLVRDTRTPLGFGQTEVSATAVYHYTPSSNPTGWWKCELDDQNICQHIQAARRFLEEEG